MALPMRRRREESSRSDRGGPGGGGRPGARDRDRDRDRDRPRIFRKKLCRFCGDKTSPVDYKDVEAIQKFLTEKGKIIPRRITGNCSKHQRVLARAIRRCRHSALVAFQTE